jgi:SAM-dependent methyltransferase
MNIPEEESMKTDEIKKIVKERYGKIAVGKGSCCGPSSTCCGTGVSPEELSKSIGYSDEEIKMVPEDANLGLGCGNPLAYSFLKEGDTVLDLGSGAGIDCFLAAEKVGKTGRVIGVDMTTEMIDKARRNADKGGYDNVEFRMGEIEHLPVESNSIDTIISNCVINLSPDKGRVFSEAFRVLKPGGQLVVSDIVLEEELPPFIIESVEAYVGCISGAMLKEEYMDAIRGAGFGEPEILDASPFPVELMMNDPTGQVIAENLGMEPEKLAEMAHTVISVKVRAVKA